MRYDETSHGSDWGGSRDGELWVCNEKESPPSLMPRKRKKYPAELKAKVALEALCENQPVSQLASKYSVHPNLVTN
jgi:hypothetical protein